MAAVTEPLAIVARRGRGKTYAGSVLAEEMLKAGQQIVVVDPMDVWYGLRSADKGEGFPIVIFGGDHADVKLTPGMGREVADFIVAEDISCIIVPEFETNQDTVEFMTAFLDRLLKQNRDPLHLFFDEAEAFAPERPAKYEARMLGAMGRLVKRGRVRGLGVTLITQRTASINKNVLSQAGGLLIMALSSPWDRAPVEKWMASNGTPEQMDAVKTDLASLSIGDAYFWHPDWDIFKRIHIRARETFDSSATPEAGQRKAEPKKWSEIDIPLISQRLEAAVQRTKAEDPAELRKQIAQLQRELRTRPTETEKVIETETVEIPILAAGEIERLEKLVTRLSVDVTAELRAVASDITDGLKLLPTSRSSFERPKSEQRVQTSRSQPRPPEVALADTGDAKFGKGERTVLAVLAQWPQGRTQNELAFLAGYSAKASTIGVILSNLRKAGLVTQGQPVRLTYEGEAQVGGYEPLPSGDALLQHWLNHQRMGEGERRVLRTLIDSYPAEMSHAELCNATGYSPDASTMGVILSKLRKLGLVEKGRRLIAAEFMEAIS